MLCEAVKGAMVEQGGCEAEDWSTGSWLRSSAASLLCSSRQVRVEPYLPYSSQGMMDIERHSRS